MAAAQKLSDLDDEVIERRADQLTTLHWRVLSAMKDEAVALKKGGAMARAAWELQQFAFAWPKRSPWWTITKHGRRAMELRERRLKAAVAEQSNEGVKNDG